MQYRKELILFVLTAAFAAWVAFGVQHKTPSVGVSSKKQDLELPSTLDVLLVPPVLRPEVSGRDMFVEPSEALPLPPRQITLPTMRPLPIVRPPGAGGGQAVASWHQLRADPLTAPDVPFDFDDSVQVGESTSVDAAATNADPDLDVDQKLRRARFDSILDPDNNLFWGEVVLEGEEKYRVALRGRPYPALRFRWMKDDRSVIKEIELDASTALGLELADTLENQIGLRRVGLPDGPDSVEDRKKFIEWLLEQGRVEPSVYAEAREQARRIVEYENQTEAGYVWLIRVLRAEGRLADEWSLYEEVAANSEGETPAWVLRGRGEVQAKLTLDVDALANLEAAVAKEKSNPRNHAALARFLMDDYQYESAVEHTENAFRQRGFVPRIDRPAIVETHLQCLLALGRADEAEKAIRAFEDTGGEESDVALYRGLVAYAKGDLTRARVAFGGSSRFEALLGRGACGVPGPMDRWADSHAALLQAMQTAPLLRGRTSASLAMLYEAAGRTDRSLQAARDAFVADPLDAYVCYVLTRQLRLQGEYDEAVENGERALVYFDQSAEIVSELALALHARYRNGGEATDLGRAFRYAQRLVDLDRDENGAVRDARYLELLGALAYELGDLAAARRAFAEGDGQESFFCRLGLAILDYAQRRTDEARQQLTTLSTAFDLPQEKRAEARRLLEEIEDHLGKELVRDDFDRDRIGKRWTAEAMGSDKVSLSNGRVELQGDKPTASREASKAKDFVRSEVTLEVADRNDTSSFAGLRIKRKGRGSRAFEAWLGVSVTQTEGFQPVFRYTNPDAGRSGEEGEIIQTLDIPGFDRFAPHRLAIEVYPSEVEDGRIRQFGMRALWNGEVVHDIPELRGITPTANDPLDVQLFSAARAGGGHVFFDDFRLTRRRAE